MSESEFTEFKNKQDPKSVKYLPLWHLVIQAHARTSAKCVPTQGVGTRQILIQTIKEKLKYRIWANAAGARPETSMLHGAPTSGSLAAAMTLTTAVTMTLTTAVALALTTAVALATTPSGFPTFTAS